MFIVKLQGGLGNQMFQYAFARSLSIRKNEYFELDASIFNNKNSNGRQYGLSDFYIKSKLTNKYSSAWFQIEKDHRSFAKIFKKIGTKIPRYIEQRYSTEIESELIDYTGNAYFCGYWQQPAFFESIREHLLNDFNLRDNLGTEARMLAQKITSVPSISIQVRRGDYVTDTDAGRILWLCENDYFQRSFEFLKNKIKCPNVFIFSDDIDWCRQNLCFGCPTTFVSSNNVRLSEEIYLMSLASHNIISNSTFGWWGAWLNRNDSKVVVAPKKWFKKCGDSDVIVPKIWLRM